MVKHYVECGRLALNGEIPLLEGSGSIIECKVTIINEQWEKMNLAHHRRPLKNLSFAICYVRYTL